MDYSRESYFEREREALWWALVVTAVFGLAAALLLWFVSFDFAKNRKPDSDVIYVEIISKPEPPAPVTPPVRKRTPAPQHERVAANDNTQQATGPQEETRTVNSRALFKMTQGGDEEIVDAGNTKAPEADADKASGTGGGLNPSGTEMLDEGLLGRGVVGSLPKPAYPKGNVGGKVVVRVTVDKGGNVTDAIYEPRGSTTSDAALVKAAIDAARRAKFTESAAFMQGGTITYHFRIK